HVAYDEWVALIARALERFYRPAPAGALSLLEIGGGTGVLACKLRRAGYDYTGSDVNFAMCQQARSKGLPFVCCDGRALPFKRSFDCALFLYDGINYLPELTDYDRLFAALFARLKDGGLFLFDITTQYNSMRNFRDFTDYSEWGDYACVRHSYFDKQQRVQHNDFSLWQRLADRENCFCRRHERHSQKVFAVPELQKRIPRDLFEIMGVWDNFTMNKWSARSERVHFLLRKKNP
ncbi:MAG: class I SAM-dependent methyltransferase, partial [Chitinivibrionales bacterium]|nr:class I SAM-dependent methyltransferase [Chitinivibrionales bacterium]